MWQHRATANLWARGLLDLRFTPGWAVGWWFVPFAYWVMPLLAVRELDRRSIRPAETRSSGSLLASWWTAWLAQSLVPAIGPSVTTWPRSVTWARSLEPDLPGRA